MADPHEPLPVVTATEGSSSPAGTGPYFGEPLPQAAGQRDETAVAAEEIEKIIRRLDTSIAEERKAMDQLLARLRTTRVAA